MTNLEAYYSALTDDCSFIFQRTCGTIIDPINPGRDVSGLYISLIRGEDLDKCAARIRGCEYYPCDIIVQKIQELLDHQFSHLVTIALKERKQFDLHSYDNIVIKMGAVHIMLDCCSLCDDDREFVYSVVDQVADLITGYIQ